MRTEKLRKIFEYDKRGWLKWKTPHPSKNYLIGKRAGEINKHGPRSRAVIQISGKRYLAHRLIFQWHFGKCLGPIDHIDLNPLNNRIENLRAATHSENQGNRRKRKDSRHPFKGIRLNKKRWAAQIRFKNKRYFLGLHSTPELAALAYDKKARELFGAFAKTNF